LFAGIQYGIVSKQTKCLITNDGCTVSLYP